ncbi:CDP-glycerol glycerophosphotransferase family protein [Mammaliicoccus sp. Dog046]|uniref:CDP-glycerol glycerophosphotransferase family protein n=1 Tax=Mammaliicoccus sp. Dog046 TaxID=3034233 RepID=UPI002B25B61D|nr:CDP-glycerol glycerophosphotransferase family protein [Mammaliicoccus sp. Dog046]WQK84764.1 CDP-glycerol glycerophosphotransferase family protein [Mammaliicoccus sp. Dog046]
MIKIIDIHAQPNLESILNSNIEASHIILKDQYTEVKENVIARLELDQSSYVVDYTNEGYYTNDSKYMGQTFINIKDWFNNITLQPNIIFEIEDLKWLVSKFKWENTFDITLNALLHLKDIKIDTHVVFDFQKKYAPSEMVLLATKTNIQDNETKFQLNKLAVLNGYQPIYRTKEVSLPPYARTLDKILFKTKFKLPNRTYQQLYKKTLNHQMQSINIYEKKQEQVKPYIVFLGFDYGYRGNSKYLFEYITKQYPKYTVYFVTEEKTGNHFIKPNDIDTQSIIEQAGVVVLESYLPDHLQPNGTIIQLWHGTPMKQLFLDSKEPKQNGSIYNYRARKYNKLKKQDYFITDVETINSQFQSAFPMEETKIIPCGYPRNQYLLEHADDKTVINETKQALNLDDEKQTILYVPTWRDIEGDHYLLDFPEEIKDNYNIIYKLHEEDMSQQTNSQQNINQFDTQELLLVADIVISDYSSTVFDALTIDKHVYLYTPDFEVYNEQRGLYRTVYDSINQNQYFDSETLFTAIYEKQYNKQDDTFINKSNHSYETITQLIEQSMI